MSDIPALILQGIRDFSANRPRSLQTAVGPSQLGNPCDHCLAAALVGWEKQGDEAWLPLIGTAVHALLLNPGYAATDALTPPAFHEPEWLTEYGVTVGQVDGITVKGTADLFHVLSGTVVDLKVVGLSTLNEARRHGASEQYRTQIQLYGHGFAREGFNVHEVTIAYLPRNSMRLSDAVFATYPYSAEHAEAALDRASDLLQTAREVEQEFNSKIRDIWIDGLKRAPGCDDCPRYPTMMTRPPSELQEYAT